MGRQTDQDWPVSVYFYDESGHHAEPIVVENFEAFNTIFQEKIRPAIAQKLEVVVTDLAENTVLHSRNGRIIFPTSDDLDGIFF